MAYGQINWGDWQQMPDYRRFLPNKNASPVASLGRTFDVTTYIPGLNEISNRVHDAGEHMAQKGNEALSPVFGAIGQVAEVVDPFQATLKKVAPEQHAAVREWVTDHPIDTMALVAAAYFGAAAGGSLGGAGGAGAGGAGGGAGAGAASAAPAASVAGGAGGTAGLQAAGAAAITPTFASGAVAPAASSAGGLLSSAGTGTLGAAGTSAATSLLTPTFSSFVVGSGSGGAGLLGSLKSAYSAAKPWVNLAQNVRSFANASQRPDRGVSDSTALADRILNSYQPDDYRGKMANSITMNRFRK